MIQTIHQHYKGYPKHKVKDATAARKAQVMTGHPTDAQFVEMVRNNTIKNCPIKPTHITNALSIFGPGIAGVHGKTVHHKPEGVEAEMGSIPNNYHRLHRFVAMTADIMFINGIV
jgi:hypothetical protein